MAGDRRFVQATAAFQTTVRKSIPASHQGRILVKKLTLEVDFCWQMAVADDNGIDRMRASATSGERMNVREKIQTRLGALETHLEAGEHLR